jgi:hypothetical protein
MTMLRGCFAAAVLLSLPVVAQPAGPDDAGVLATAPAAGPFDPLVMPDAGTLPAPQLAVVAVPPPPAPERSSSFPPARVSLSEYMLSSYHLDNGNVAQRGTAPYDPTGSNYVDFLNRVQMDAAWNSLTAVVRVDSAVYGNAPQAAAGDAKLTQLLINRYNNRLDLEKIALSYTSRFLDVTLGDTYVTYGRGLVLSLRKVDEFGIDTTVRGLSATGHIGGFSLNVLGGWSNIVNVDYATGRSANDPNDFIFGSRAEYKFGRWATVGGDVSHVIYAQNLTSGTQDTKDQVTSFSGTLELPHLGDFGTFFAEVAGQQRITAGVPLWTWGMYATASVYLRRLTLLLEYKDYRNYNAIPTSLDPTQYPELALNNFYTAAPTLERVQQIVLNNTDVMGGHLRASFKASPDVVPFVSMALFDDRTYQTTIYDPYLGIELRWNDGASRASISGGFRANQYHDGSAAPGSMFQSAAHAEWDITQHLFGPYSAEVSGLHFSHHDAQGAGYLNWQEGQAYLSFKRAQLFSVAAGFEYYTEAPQVVRPYYVNLSGTWNIIDNLLVRLFIGGQRAGIKCVNGVCRNYPAFEGARLELIAKY